MAKAKKWTIWILIIAAIAGSIFWYVKSREPKTTYTTADVAKGTLAQTVSVTGKANPNEQIDLTFRMTGILKSINAEVGDYVETGKVLATIDTGTLESQLREAAAQVKYQEKTLDYMKKHNSTYKRDQLDAQKAQIDQAEAGIGVIKDQLKNINIVSPVDGIVIRRTADPGETVVLDLNSPVLTIARVGDLVIESNVPESDIIKLQLGQKADVTFDAFSQDEIFSAVVSEIDPASTVIQDVVYYRIKLKLDNLDPKLKAGMSANIDVRTNEKENVLMIPVRAINEDGKKKFVEVLKADGIMTEKKYIETGLEGDDGMVEVKSGLNSGEKVITFVATK